MMARGVRRRRSPSSRRPSRSKERRRPSATEVRLLYDDQAVYVGIMCFDSDPSQIVTTDARRDSSLGDSDSVQIIFDTYHDRQNGFIFGTNPAGMEYDAQVRSEGETQSSGPPTLGPRRRRFGRRHERELGRRLDGEGADHRQGVVGRVPHSAAHAALRPGAADLGHQLLAHHPPQARAGLLVADFARLQHHAPVGRRRGRRPPAEDADEPEGDAVRASTTPNRNFTPGATDRQQRPTGASTPRSA